jgi:hypothetical protein
MTYGGKIFSSNYPLNPHIPRNPRTSFTGLSSY